MNLKLSGLTAKKKKLGGKTGGGGKILVKENVTRGEDTS